MVYFKKQINRLAKNFPSLLALSVFGFMLIYYGILGQKPTVPNTTGSPIPSVEADFWITYKNQEFGFEINHPAAWKISEFPQNQLGPIFNFYPPETNELPPFIHFSDTNHVSIYPFGIPTEGINGEYQESVIKTKETTAEATDFILENGSPWATFVSFSKKPSAWQESGLVFAGAKIKNQRLVCLRGDQPLPMENCDPFTGDLIIRGGEIDNEIRKLQEAMLASFRFLK